MEEILELGKRSPDLARTCFDVDTISAITDKLPFRDILYIYDIELTGQAQLREILSVLRRRKVNAQRRADSKSNLTSLLVTPQVLSSNTSPPSSSLLKRRRQRRKRRPNTSANAIPPLMSIVISDAVKNAANITSFHNSQNGLSVLPIDKLFEYTGDDAARVAALQGVPHLADCHGAARVPMHNTSRTSHQSLERGGSTVENVPPPPP